MRVRMRGVHARLRPSTLRGRGRRRRARLRHEELDVLVGEMHVLDGLLGFGVWLDVELDVGTVVELDDLGRLVGLDVLDDLGDEAAHIYDQSEA